VEVNGLSEFLEAQGISWMQRKLAMNCNPVDTIKVDGQKLTISYTGIYKLISRFHGFKLIIIGSFSSANQNIKMDLRANQKPSPNNRFWNFFL